MQTNRSLNDLTESVFREIDKFGLGCATKRFYKQAFNSFKAFATTRDIDTFSESLVSEFLEDIEEKYKTGVVNTSKRKLLRRISLLLRDYVADKTFGWKYYVFKRQPMPVSHELLLLHSRVLDHLRFSGKCGNTIQSGKNSVRQFLLFLEDNGCSTLSMATPDMVLSFFQHMLGTYRPTSIRTVASNIRSLLDIACIMRTVGQGKRRNQGMHDPAYPADPPHNNADLATMVLGVPTMVAQNSLPAGRALRAGRKLPERACTPLPLFRY